MSSEEHKASNPLSPDDILLSHQHRTRGSVRQANTEEKNIPEFLSPSNEELYQAKIYEPLDADPNKIRLVRISPGKQDDPIHCSLVQPVCLSDQPDYIAVSYCAGDPKKTTPIMLNGLHVNLFASIAEALPALRKEDIGVLVWIDQICIDQHNDLEKGHQVKMMNRIYASATKTLIWFGNDEYLADAFRFIDRVSSHLKAQLIIEQGSSLLPTPFRLLQFLENLRQKTVTQRRKIWWPCEDDLAAFRALRKLLSHPWWTRCWCVQEFSMSKKVFVIYDKVSFEFWEQLRCITMYLSTHTGNLMKGSNPAVEDEVKRLRVTCLLIRSFANTMEDYVIGDKIKRKGFARSLLKSMCERQSTDPRDHIYSIVGMIDPGYDIQPDYRESNTLQDVFISTTKSFITFDHTLDIVSIAGWGFPQQNLDLPTWVPDFSAPRNWWLDVSRGNKGDDDDTWRAGMLSKNLEVDFRSDCVPCFLPDEEYRKDRILRCEVLGLGRVADPETIQRPTPFSAKNNLSKTDHPIDRYWLLRILWHAGLLESYLSRPNPGTSDDPWISVMTVGTSQQYHNLEDRKEMLRRLKVTLLFSCFFVTRDKRIGSTGEHVRYDDLLCIPASCSVPWILRAVPGYNDRYTYVCTAYLDGAMYGELMDRAVSKDGRKALSTVFIQ